MKITELRLEKVLAAGAAAAAGSAQVQAPQTALLAAADAEKVRRRTAQVKAGSLCKLFCV